MTAEHAHLVLNHVPIVGVACAAALFVVARIARSDQFQQVALWALVLFALVAVPVYLTGEPTAHAVRRLPGVSRSVIEPHERAALLALAAVEGLGAVALGGTLFLRNRPRIPARFAAGLVVLSAVTTGLLVYTGYLGGRIRRPELRPGNAAAADAERAPREGPE